ncbi:MAG: hypothetical protein ACE5F1_01045 [Planctomycetota bacterium]
MKGSDEQLASIVRNALQAIAANLESLVDKSVELQLNEPTILDQTLLGSSLSGKHTVMHGDLEKDFEGRIYLIFTLVDSITFSCYLRTLADDVVSSNRDGLKWTDEDEESFGEVGNILFSALDETLRNALSKEVNASMGCFKLTDFGQDEADLQGEGPYVMYDFSCTIGDFPRDKGMILIPLGSAEAFNGAPLLQAGDALSGEELIEAAPIRGNLAIYSAHEELLKTLRLCCRRVGLTFDRRPRSEVPNPAKHRDNFVLLEIGRGQGKRFEWCKRLKGSSTRVVIILLQPTPATVALAYKAGADLIMGWPVEERQLSSRLDGLFRTEEAEA